MLARRRIALTLAIVGVLMTMAGAATSDGGLGLLPLGSQAPDFQLPDVVSGQIVSRGDFAGRKARLVIFLCRHCPYVQHVKDGVAQLARDYAGQEVGVVAISANDPAAYPEDAPDRLKAMAIESGFTFPLCFDESQAVAKAYTALCTPDFFLFDTQGKLVYRGQFDDSRPGSRTPVTGHDVRAAIDAVLAGRPVPVEQKPSIGCSIKWKPDREPPYAR